MLIERAIWLGKPDLGIPAEAQGWRCTTPAKINLFLEVLGKRSDGYHDLDTVMHAIDLTDTLEIFPSSNSALTMSIDFSNAQQIERPSTPAPDPAWDIPSNRSNLILKALETLRNSLDQKSINTGAHVILRKRIPSQAGLGGGSSNAAAALLLGSLLWTNQIPAELLSQIAMQLGSDINFFLDGHNGLNWTARCTGRGERVQPVPNYSSLYGVLVHPPQGCNTGAVFSELSKQLACDLPAKSPSDLLKLLSEESALATESPPQQSQRSEKLASMLYNALESAAKRTSDWVQRTSYQLEQHQPVGHCLTGSGSARFCLCSGQAQAETLSEILRKEGDLRVYTFRTWNTPSISQQWSEMHRDGHY